MSIAYNTALLISCEMDKVLSLVDRVVTPEMNQSLLQHYTTEEVQRALFQMHPSKSLGLEGVSPFFFQKFWHICQDICESLVRNICHYFMELAYPLIKHTLLVFGQIQDVFNTSRNCVSRSSVEDMQVCPRFRLKNRCSLELDSQLSIELKKLFQPRGLTAT